MVASMAAVHGCGSVFIHVSKSSRVAGISVNAAAAVLHAVADRFLVNIQTDVVHISMGEPPWLYLNQRGRPSSSDRKHDRFLSFGIDQCDFDIAMEPGDCVSHQVQQSAPILGDDSSTVQRCEEASSNFTVVSTTIFGAGAAKHSRAKAIEQQPISARFR